MTWLLNSEIGPAFMQDGRVSFTAEKATPEFYQLSGRRMNWDRTDYHPLLAQRAQSTDTFTDRSAPVGRLPAGDRDPRGARPQLPDHPVGPEAPRARGGALATFNRSIGPFEADRTEVTFLRSLVIVDPAATGRAGTAGVYRSPFSLPNGEILASYAANVTDPTTQSPQVRSGRGRRRRHAPRAGQRSVACRTSRRRWATSAPSASCSRTCRSWCSAATAIRRPTRRRPGVMHFPDLPVLATLLGANLRRGRDVKAFDSTASLRVYEEKPPAVDDAAADRQPDGVQRSHSCWAWPGSSRITR